MKGSKDKYTKKQKRMAHHIEDSAKKRGYSQKRAEEIGWATVNKETGGAGKAVKNTEPSKKGGRKGGKAKRSHADRSAAAKKGWRTRRRHESQAA